MSENKDSIQWFTALLENHLLEEYKDTKHLNVAQRIHFYELFNDKCHDLIVAITRKGEGDLIIQECLEIAAIAFRIADIERKEVENSERLE